ncbi:hypothetical protein BH11BAC2_BH11BAC2_16440 [soil metagenome]
MKKNLLLLFLLMFQAFGLYAQSSIQMPLPPQSSTLQGSVRGYWFISPTCFTITGLEAPLDASTGLQNIAVVRLDSLPPVYGNTTNNFTLLYLTQNDTTSGIIPVSIQVGVGDVIGILGNRDDNNSYGISPFTSSINNFPVTVTRLGMQFPLSTDTVHEIWTEIGGSISRVWMYYDTNYVFNISQIWQGGTSYSFTNGAGSTATSVWDYGDGSPLDTAYNPTHIFPSPGDYNVCSYITGSCVSDTVCTLVIMCPAPALANYNYAINFPDVSFTDNSQNATAFSWDFGDGSPVSTIASPSHTFPALGLYHVCLTVTDTCGGMHTYCENISVCPGLIPVTLGTDVTACGSAILTPQFPNATYLWSTGETTSQINALNTGSYIVTVIDANGCSGRDTIDVLINPLPIAPFINNINQCGDSIILDALNPGELYLWNTGATSQTINVTVNGTYTVTITDGLGCVNTDDIVVNLLVIPPVNLGNDLNICQGLTAISGPNGTGYTYLWNDGTTFASLLLNSSGTYWVNVTAPNGCSASDTIVIVMNAPAVSYIETQTLLCLNSSPITLAAGIPSGGTYSGSGVTGNVFNPSVAGLGNKNIIYAVTDTSGCVGRDTSVITVSSCSGIAEILEIGMQLYPNPSKGVFNLSFRSLPELLTITDNNGKILRTIFNANKEMMINLTSEADGIYYLNATMEKKQFTIPFIIKK